jgi:hypothetical protein
LRESLKYFNSDELSYPTSDRIQCIRCKSGSYWIGSKLSREIPNSRMMAQTVPAVRSLLPQSGITGHGEHTVRIRFQRQVNTVIGHVVFGNFLPGAGCVWHEQTNELWMLCAGDNRITRTYRFRDLRQRSVRFPGDIRLRR